MTKKAIFSAFENYDSPYYRLVNDTLALVTIISIASVALETVPSIQNYSIFKIIEWFSVILFSLEYMLRIWSSPKRLRYIFSFFGLVDLVSILPSLLGVGNLTFLKSARIVRILRFLRLLRLVKLSRVKSSRAGGLGVFSLNIFIYFIALISILFIFGLVLHLSSSEGGHYWSIPGGMLWALLVFFSYPPEYEVGGSFGLVITILAKFCGMVMFGLLIGVTGQMLNNFLLGRDNPDKSKKEKKNKE